MDRTIEEDEGRTIARAAGPVKPSTAAPPLALRGDAKGGLLRVVASGRGSGDSRPHDAYPTTVSAGADGVDPTPGGYDERMPMAARKILICDDDDDLREALVEQLSLYEEFETQATDGATKAIAAARAEPVDLLIMDVGLPEMDGREAVKLLRKGGFKAPIIMLTGHDTESDTILGLEAGANDYVTKPFKFAVLLARIRAHLRQHEQTEDAVFSIGRYTFRPSTKLMVDERGSKVRLTEKETAILKYLYRAGEKPVTREVLLHEVWGYNSGVTTHTLETHIYRLRQKIERDPSNAELLVTEAGGYKLVP
jgi:DNA-binding response OmpR family regulator